MKTEIAIQNLSVYYDSFQAVKDVSLDIPRNHVTAFIGPSGCGKSTILRSINRMNELVPGARVTGRILFRDKRYIWRKCRSSGSPPTHRHGFSETQSHFHGAYMKHIAWGARINGIKDNLDELVETSLRQAALWGEVKDKLKQNALRPFRRTATTPVHCPGHSHKAAHHSYGRTSIRPGPHLHHQN